MDISSLSNKIQLIKELTEEIKSMSKEFPAVERNAVRILASIKMLELNVTDILILDSTN